MSENYIYESVAVGIHHPNLEKKIFQEEDGPYAVIVDEVYLMVSSREGTATMFPHSIVISVWMRKVPSKSQMTSKEQLTSRESDYNPTDWG